MVFDSKQLKDLYEGHKQVIERSKYVIELLDGVTCVDKETFCNKVRELEELFKVLKDLLLKYLRDNVDIHKELSEVHSKMHKIELEIIER